MEDQEQKIGFLVRKLGNALRKTRELQNCEGEMGGLTMMQGWILGYLVKHSDHEIYQRELESRLNIGKSTLTEVLHLMERNGLVRREPAPSDGRLKRIVLTEKSRRIDSMISRNIQETEERLKQGIPEEDIQVFLRTIQKMIENISDDEEKGKGECKW